VRLNSALTLVDVGVMLKNFQTFLVDLYMFTSHRFWGQHKFC